MSSDRWFLRDRKGRKMVGFRTRRAGRRWLRDVAESNPPAVAGWLLMSSKDATALGEAVSSEAIDPVSVIWNAWCVVSLRRRRDRREAIRNASRLLHSIADRVGDRFDYVIGDAGPFREAAEALDRLAGDKP